MVGSDPGWVTVRVVTDTVVPGAGVVTRVTVWGGADVVVVCVRVVDETLVAGVELTWVAVELVTDAPVEVALAVVVECVLEAVRDRAPEERWAANAGLRVSRWAGPAAATSNPPPAEVADAVVELACPMLAAVGGLVCEEGLPLPQPAASAAVALPAMSAATPAAIRMPILRVVTGMSTTP